MLSALFSLVLGLARRALPDVARSARCGSLAYVYIQVFRALSLYIYVLWIYFGIAAGIGVNFSAATSRGDCAHDAQLRVHGGDLPLGARLGRSRAA